MGKAQPHLRRLLRRAGGQSRSEGSDKAVTGADHERAFQAGEIERVLAAHQASASVTRPAIARARPPHAVSAPPAPRPHEDRIAKKMPDAGQLAGSWPAARGSEPLRGPRDTAFRQQGVERHQEVHIERRGRTPGGSFDGHGSPPISACSATI